jgi:4-hydroxyacetophenone monooxygenase
MIGLFTWHEDFLVPDPDWERQGGHITRKSEELRQFLIGYIREQVKGRPDLIEKLLPDYAPMVRRPVVDNGWYEALTRENVELVTDGIARLTRTGIETVDGEQRDVDTIVFATGYNVSTYLWPAEYHGEDGVNLQEFWAEDSPRAYLGMLVPRFPNLFVMYGPNSQPVSGGISLPSWFQIWAAYIGQCLVTMIEGGHSKVAVTDTAFEDYNQRLDAEASGMAFVTDKASVKRNYYLNADGRLQANTPFETADLWAMFKAPKRSDLEFS